MLNLKIDRIYSWDSMADALDEPDGSEAEYTPAENPGLLPRRDAGA
jgi:hypothetical protein